MGFFTRRNREEETERRIFKAIHHMVRELKLENDRYLEGILAPTSLWNFVSDKDQYWCIDKAVHEGENIIVTGGPGAGTQMFSVFLMDMAMRAERAYVLIDRAYHRIHCGGYESFADEDDRMCNEALLRPWRPAIILPDLYGDKITIENIYKKYPCLAPEAERRLSALWIDIKYNNETHKRELTLTKIGKVSEE